MAEVLNPWGIGAARRSDDFGTRTARSYRARTRPYELRINGSRRGAFEEVRDAVSSARIANKNVRLH